MQLFLMRHGDAANAEFDEQRPLSPLGLNQVEKVAIFFARQQIPIEHIYHSGLLRAQRTAESIAEKVSMQAQFKRGLLPEDNPELLASELQHTQDNIILVGHMPFMSRLAAELCLGNSYSDIVKFSTATMVCLEKLYQTWLIKWLVTPDILSR